MWARRDLKSRIFAYLRRALSLTVVLIATCAGGYLALVGYHQSKTLTVGEIRMSMSPGHRGALDVYVPLVDWGARFEAIRAPIRLRVDLQTVDRTVATSLAQGKSLDVEQVRNEARDALASYLKRLIALTLAERARARAAHGVRDPQQDPAAADGRPASRWSRRSRSRSR